MTITHQIVNSDPNATTTPVGGDITSQLSGLIGQVQALSTAGVGLPGIQSIGTQISSLSSAITGAGGTTDIASNITSLGTQLASSTASGVSGLLTSLTSQLSNLTSLLNPSGLISQVLHTHILDQAKGILHSAFQGKHTVALGSGGIDITSASKVAATAPIIPHNGLTMVSDALQVTLGITAQSFGMLSDEKLKTNVDEYPSVLEKVMQLKLKSFDVRTVDWETGDIHHSEPRPSFGLIAQDVQKVFPQLVSDGKFLSIEEGKVGLLLLAAFQEFVIEVRRDIAELRK